MTTLAPQTDQGQQHIQTLYHQLLSYWNSRDAAGFASLFAEDGSAVGFDGSTMNGKAEIFASLQQIFAHHPTGAYIGIVREVRQLVGGAALLRAVAGMVPPGAEGLNPAVHTIQSLVAIQEHDSWSIALYHNTPAQFHGRPELVEQLTSELEQALLARRQAD
ncbi:SgcJ/EcaC family oxidoreductase [Chloroflexia bacterium SDU3-3]|nr:SgcJ/EcaC family oxidoreductase [Chloroflexia bacterium SDU3-3]